MHGEASGLDMGWKNAFSGAVGPKLFSGRNCGAQWCRTVSKVLVTLSCGSVGVVDPHSFTLGADTLPCCPPEACLLRLSRTFVYLSFDLPARLQRRLSGFEGDGTKSNAHSIGVGDGSRSARRLKRFASIVSRSPQLLQAGQAYA